jgi:citrate lyase gamma subunit
MSVLAKKAAVAETLNTFDCIVNCNTMESSFEIDLLILVEPDFGKER